jgi:chromosome segregation ATPase
MVELSRSTLGFIQELRSKVTDTDRKLQRLRDIYLDQDIEKEEYKSDKNNMMSEKKSLEEQIARFEQNGKAWVEPMKNFIKDAQTRKRHCSWYTSFAEKTVCTKSLRFEPLFKR